MATIPPGAYAPEVLRTFGVPRAPIPDHAGARDACTRARAVARVLLLVAPISLPAALEAARAAWAGEYGPAQRAPKNPTGYWAAAAVVLRAATVAPAAEPAEWRPAWSGAHATTAAGAGAGGGGGRGPRGVFGAYAGVVAGAEAQLALAAPPAPAGRDVVPDGSAAGRVLSHCAPAALAPPHDAALYAAAHAAAGRAR